MAIELSVTKAEALEGLYSAIAEAREVFNRQYKSETGYNRWQAQVVDWKETTEYRLRNIFVDPEYIQAFEQIATFPLPIAEVAALASRGNEEYSLIVNCVVHLRSLAERIVLSEDVLDENRRRSTAKSRRVFIVHGHDESLPDKVWRILNELDLEPIILAEQHDESLTIIEKFERYADVWYAVVLLTPDDIGASKADPESKKDRARQNVILELGFFMGILGRSNVCVLHKGNIEKPSDINGVLYLPVDDAGAWRDKLGRRLKKAGQAVGIEIDMNKLHS
jgi:predicted nucleotide-binding protein